MECEIYLFGSSASAMCKPLSDIDLLVVYNYGDEAPAISFRRAAAEKAPKVLGRQVDITLLNRQEESELDFARSESAILIMNFGEPWPRRPR
ncbi:nucleotidyltransferase domain-containing protein [Kitasatospora phosalacinea]|uniref:nucleotidyltransferase domain-containing protein n=1 Tax=Kitasatospora phosalacinea TaxID=2065 RepID=UPI0036636018